HDWYGPRVLQQRTHGGGAVGQHDVRPQHDQLCRVAANIAGNRTGPANLETHVLAVDPSGMLQFRHEGTDLFPCKRITFGEWQENADNRDSSGLLRARHHRPRCGAAEQGDELAPSHSITSSARARSEGGISRPSALAVLRLIASSYLVGACTGRSA